MPDENRRRYLFVAIDRATMWVYLLVYDDLTQASSTDFLLRLRQVAAFKITKVLTDNGTQFTDRFTSKEKQLTGKHLFDQQCIAQGIEHRLIPTPASPKQWHGGSL